MDLGLRIKKINDLMEKRANRQMQNEDLTFSQHHVLVYLIHCPEYTAPLKELEKYFRVAQATMAGIVVRLESKGLVESSVSSKDKRVKMVTLTEEGAESCRRSYRYMKAGEEKLKVRLSEDDVRELERLLDIVYQTMHDDLETDGSMMENGKENI